VANLAVALKDEIRRLARKEIREQTDTTKKSVANYRREIAQLKRRLDRQERKLAFLETEERKRLEQPAPEGAVHEDARFSARSVKAQRRRLKLSAKDYARLVGVTPLTVYNWEHGKTRPKPAQFAALVALRGIGRREAMAKLELLEAETRGNSKPRRKRRPRAK
jgi:DNA-binding transcriptional regulator YiaG